MAYEKKETQVPLVNRTFERQMEFEIEAEDEHLANAVFALAQHLQLTNLSSVAAPQVSFQGMQQLAAPAFQPQQLLERSRNGEVRSPNP